MPEAEPLPPTPLTVDEWVEKLRGTSNVGEMTHWQRLEKAFKLEEPDMVPVAPELDYWQMYDAGYTQHEVFEGPGAVEKRTDACIRSWAKYRPDAIWPYVDLVDLIDPFIPPVDRERYKYGDWAGSSGILRGPRDYVLFKPITSSIDEAIKLFADRVWEKNGLGHALEYFGAHVMQLIDFQNKMNNTVPVFMGISTPSNLVETMVEVQRFVKWMITQPKQKLRDLMTLAAEERIEAATKGYKTFYDAGGRWIVCFGGNRTVGPKQHEEFKIYEELFLERVRRVFPHVIWHHCGQNLKEAIQWIAEDAPGVEAAQFDSPVTQYKMSWSEWFEWAAKTFKGRRCAMNSPTTQLAMFGTSEQVKDFVGTFIRSTAKHTTAAVMPGCEIGGYTPPDNVTAMIAAAREYGRYPIKT